jgi:hypothetical protein
MRVIALDRPGSFRLASPSGPAPRATQIVVRVG